MVFVSISKETAIANYGSSWAVDHEASVVVECIGDMRPPFHCGVMYETVERAYVEEEAVRPDVRSYEVRPLPPRIRVPVRLPVPFGTLSGEDRPPGVGWVLHMDNILGNGVRLECLQVSKIGFRKAPPSLDECCDVVAAWVWLRSDGASGTCRTFKVGVEYDDDGRIRADQMVMACVDSGSFERLPTATVYFSEREAVAAADSLAAMLVEASDWRRHSTWTEKAGTEVAA